MGKDSGGGAGEAERKALCPASNNNISWEANTAH